MKLFLQTCACMIFLAGFHTAQAAIVIDADSSTNGTDISNAFAASGVTLSAVGGGSVFAATSPGATTGTLAFAYLDALSAIDSHWARATSPVFRADFTGFTASQVMIDFNADPGSGTIEAFDTGGSSLGTSTVNSQGVLSIGAAAIAAIQVDLNGGDDFGVLDNLRITAVPEPSSGLALTFVGFLGALRRRRSAN